MNRVLQLAKKGMGCVSPNPLVGSLIVKNDRILSEGYHAYFGGPHAERVALLQLSEQERHNATLYVNLEPCCHQGKTPPCTDLIIESKLHRVVIGTLDPNPLVHGKGIDILHKSGIQVLTDVLKNRCRKLNEPYFKYITTSKPYVTLKIAQTLDGKIATDQGYSRWITGESARRMVHRLRKEHDAILVGAGTVIHDDPELTVRMVRGKSPKRIILDRFLDIPLKSRVLHHPESQNTIIVTTPKVSHDKIKEIKEMGITHWSIESDSNGSIHFPTLWRNMVTEGIISVLVEGGKEVLTSFMRLGEVDRIIVCMAPIFFGEGLSVFGDLGVHTPNEAIRLKEVTWHRKGSDLMLEGRF
ncbi:bifunctional diaminohydroxyphosphoribosylaminopyrimidine deaminase/5-amino-6-(5-phosphoribosylamino)uracil reductase RibD [bacterium]|nr:bifunctional diaminohydroxyphosphoribosylaminopyrimidine deaminase/5-amino-6-(5-phosphoribosylamino)uracil reductase RibD [bacterium]